MITHKFGLTAAAMAAAVSASTASAQDHSTFRLEPPPSVASVDAETPAHSAQESGAQHRSSTNQSAQGPGLSPADAIERIRASERRDRDSPLYAKGTGPIKAGVRYNGKETTIAVLGFPLLRLR